jgi:hypothetical protein
MAASGALNHQPGRCGPVRRKGGQSGRPFCFVRYKCPRQRGRCVALTPATRGSARWPRMSAIGHVRVLDHVRWHALPWWCAAPRRRLHRSRHSERDVEKLRPLAGCACPRRPLAARARHAARACRRLWRRIVTPSIMPRVAALPFVARPPAYGNPVGRGSFPGAYPLRHKRAPKTR